MAQPIPLDFGVQSEPGRYGPDAGPRLINAYPEQASKRGKAEFPIFAIEGLASFATLSGGGVFRGGISLGDYGYVVSGTSLFRVDDSGNVVTIGSFPGSQPVFMARNRKATPQIMIVSNGLRYICESDVVASISDTDLPAANSVTGIDGYFLATVQDGRFFISSIDEGTAWDALDFASAEGQADDLLVAYARGREVALFGSESIEFWANTGAADFPFEQIQGAFIRNLGCLCRHSVRDLNDIVFFVASDGTVRRLNGYTPERVSTHDVERAIDAIADKDSITATTYSIRGHQFYVLSSDDWTWAYDGLTGVWHERQSYQIERWRGEGFVDVNGKRIVGDYADGLLYEVDPDTYDEAGAHLVWKGRSAPVHAYPASLIFNRLFLDTIPGVGLNSADAHDADPQIMLRWSDTGGKTWSSEITAPVGKIGEFSKRVVFDRLGQSGEDGRIFEYSVSAAVIKGMTGAATDVEVTEP